MKDIGEHNKTVSNDENKLILFPDGENKTDTYKLKKALEKFGIVFKKLKTEINNRLRGMVGPQTDFNTVNVLKDIKSTLANFQDSQIENAARQVDKAALAKDQPLDSFVYDRAAGVVILDIERGAHTFMMSRLQEMYSGDKYFPCFIRTASHGCDLPTWRDSSRA